MEESKESNYTLVLDLHKISRHRKWHGSTWFSTFIFARRKNL